MKITATFAWSEGDVSETVTATLEQESMTEEQIQAYSLLLCRAVMGGEEHADVIRHLKHEGALSIEIDRNEAAREWRAKEAGVKP